MTCYAAECQLWHPYLYDPSQQLARLSAEDVKKGMMRPGADGNDYEFGMIQK